MEKFTFSCFQTEPEFLPHLGPSCFFLMHQLVYNYFIEGRQDILSINLEHFLCNKSLCLQFQNNIFSQPKIYRISKCLKKIISSNELYNHLNRFSTELNLFHFLVSGKETEQVYPVYICVPFFLIVQKERLRRSKYIRKVTSPTRSSRHSSLCCNVSAQCT